MAGRAQVAAMVIGTLAGLVGIYHGYNEYLQGNVATGSVFINAIGPPCQGNSCFPAMTLIPNFETTGLVAIAMSVVVLLWSVTMVQRPRGGLVLITLSIVQLLVGGGFLPPALGIVAGIIGTRIKRPGA